MWLNPDPRAVIPIDGFHCSRSLARTVRRKPFRVSFDEAFGEVMRGCADRKETWITKEFLEACGALARLGRAHSVEVWTGTELVGGLYGVCLGGAFFAESKFHRARDASKVALSHLVQRLTSRGFLLLEVQFLTPHLKQLGAIEIPAEQYHQLLRRALKLRTPF